MFQMIVSDKMIRLLNYYFPCIILIFSIASVYFLPQITALAAEKWETPGNVSNSPNDSNSPSIAVDPSGIVHLVWSEIYPGENNSFKSYITYSFLSDSQWSTPNEIITGPSSQQALFPIIRADSKGYLHLVWRGDGIQYSKAFAPAAVSSQSWSEPKSIGEWIPYVDFPYLSIDDHDNLHLTYSVAYGDKSGIYYTQSMDSGETWTDPVLVFKNSIDKVLSYPRIALSKNGNIHIVWVDADYPKTFPATGINYAVSVDNGQNWSEPVRLASGPYNFPAIQTRNENEVHVVYSGTADDRFKFHIMSEDNGKSWSDPWRNQDIGGYQGLPDLVIDSDLILHWITSATIFSINNDGLYALEFNGENWSNGETVLKNTAIVQNLSDVSAVVASGNILHTVVQYPVFSSEDERGYQFEIFHTSKILTSQPIPTEEFLREIQKTPSIDRTNMATEVMKSNTLESPVPLISSEPTKTNQFLPILAGSISAIILIVIFFSISFYKKIR